MPDIIDEFISQFDAFTKAAVLQYPDEAYGFYSRYLRDAIEKPSHSRDDRTSILFVATHILHSILAANASIERNHNLDPRMRGTIKAIVANAEKIHRAIKSKSADTGEETEVDARLITISDATALLEKALAKQKSIIYKCRTTLAMHLVNLRHSIDIPTHRLLTSEDAATRHQQVQTLEKIDTYIANIHELASAEIEKIGLAFSTFSLLQSHTDVSSGSFQRKWRKELDKMLQSKQAIDTLHDIFDPVLTTMSILGLKTLSDVTYQTLAAQSSKLGRHGLEHSKTGAKELLTLLRDPYAVLPLEKHSETLRLEQLKSFIAAVLMIADQYVHEENVTSLKEYALFFKTNVKDLVKMQALILRTIGYTLPVKLPRPTLSRLKPTL